MPKISQITTVSQPKLSDKLLGTSVGGTPNNETYNFTLQQLKDLLEVTPAEGNLQNVLDAGNSAVQDIYLTGKIETTDFEVFDSAYLTNLYLSGVLYDKINSVGTNGQVLSSTVDGIQWITLSTEIPTLQQVLNAGNVADSNIILTGDIQTDSIESPEVTASSALRVQAALFDGSNSAGSTGQVLSSTGTETSWTALPSYSAVSPLIYNSVLKQFSIQVANSTQAGYLSAADWINFDGKQNAGSYITALTGEATASGPGVANITLNSTSVTAKTLAGLNITGGTVTASDSILTAFGKLQNEINGLIGGSVYQGTWNAAINSPILTSSVGTKGHYYIVDVAGNTNLNGITNWEVGDWVIYSGTVWQKVDNTDSVISVNGYTGAVSLTTNDIPEGPSNLYYTNVRSRQALSFAAGSGAYDNVTGVITIPTNNNQLLNGSNFITLSSLSATTPLSFNNLTGDFSISQANVASDGYLSSTDYNFFASKVNPSRQVNTVGPLQGGGDLSANLSLSITQAGTSTDGYLSQTDWNTFNSKQGVLSGTGLVKSTSGTISYITDNSADWNTAFDNSIVSAAVTGTTTKTLTLTQEDGGTITADWTDYDNNLVTSVFGRIGDVVAESGDYTTTLVTEGTNLYFTDARAREAISSSAVGLTYTEATGDFSLTPGYSIPSTLSQGDWDTAYNNSIVSAAVTGTSTKTLTLTQQDGGTITADWSDIDTGLTSVGLSMPSAFAVTNSPLTSNGTLSVIGAGTSLQYVDGTGALQTFPILTGYVPYTGATQNLNLGTYGAITDFVEFNTNPSSLPTAQGTMYWDADKETVDVILNGTTGSIFQDTYFFVKNQTGTSIPKGTVVRANGTVGASGRILVAPFLANGSFDSKYCIGVATETIADGADGRVTYFGAIRGIDTSMYVNGTVLYASPSVVGGFTATEPSGPTNNIISVAIVVYSDNNNGEIFVRPTFVPSAIDIAKSLNYTPANQAITLSINGATYDLSANRTWSVGTVTAVDMSVPTGFTVANNPITSSGILALDYASGYSLPTNASQANWDTAYANRIASLTTTGTSGAATLSSNNLNIPQYQAQGNYITALTGEATASGPGSASVTLSNSAVTGKVLTGLNVTGSTILDTDSILVAFGKLQNQVNQLVGGLQYEGTWNASTNTPAITSGVGTDGTFYIVSVAGSTNIDGITDWQVGDWIVFHTPSWQKVDNTDSVSSVFGRVGNVTAAQSDYSAYYPLISDLKDGILTVQGDGVLGGSGTFSANQATNATISITHDSVSRTNTTSSASPAFGATFTAIDSITSSAEGHITGVNTKTVTIPNTTAPNNATITLSAGSGISGGGDFTTDQSVNETITFSHGATSSQPSVNNSGRTFIQDITLDAFGHVTGLVSATDSDTYVGTVTSVSGTGGYGGLTLSGTVTTSGSITLGGTPSGTWPINISGDAATVDGYSASTSTLGNHIVVRDGNGYIFGNYINMTDDGNPGGGSAITSFITKQGDNYYRSVSPNNAMISIRNVASGTWPISVAGSSFSSEVAQRLQSGWTNWASASVINNVVGMLGWKNYSNNHVIFDASASTSPTGSGVNNTNSDVAWSATYPTLMGWNGSSTYGVRVDSARVADNGVFSYTAGDGLQYNTGGVLQAKLKYPLQFEYQSGVYGYIGIDQSGLSVGYANNAGMAISAGTANNFSYLSYSGSDIYFIETTYSTPGSGNPGIWAGSTTNPYSNKTYINANDIGAVNYDGYYKTTMNPYGFYGSVGNYYSGGFWANGEFTSQGISGYDSNNGNFSHNIYQIQSYHSGGTRFLWSWGDIYTSGVLYQNSPSDSKFKDNVKPIENALDKVKTIGGVEFDWNELGTKETRKKGHDVGVIAQQVQSVYPIAVREYDREAEDRVYSHLVVDHEKLHPLAFQAIKELSAIVDELKSEIQTLKSKINGSNI